MSNQFIGEIRMGGWNFAPFGWAFCNGALLPIAQYEALFNLIGTTYGGDGINTFALPDFRGRIPIHQGTGYALSQTGGSETVTLSTNQIPIHNHSLKVDTGAATNTNPTGLTFASSGVDVYITPTNPVNTAASTTATGGSQPHGNLMPYSCVTFVIALQGIFPSQS